MKLFKYSEYITESKLELLLEANMQFSKDFLAVVASVNNPISKKILKLYKTSVDVDTNYIDLSDNENFLKFKSDRRVETNCIIITPGEIYDVLSKKLFPSFASICKDDDGDRPYGENWRNYIEHDQPARIVKLLTSDDDRLSTTLKDSIERGQSLYHIKWNFGDENKEYECIIGGSGIRKGERIVTAQEVRVGSLIQSLLKKSGHKVDGSELEDFVVKFNSEVKSKKVDIYKDFEIVKGEDIRKYYLHSNYESDEYTLGTSCMRHNRCQSYLDIYVKNPEQVSMVILFSEEETKEPEEQDEETKEPRKIRGRAILWTNPQYDRGRESISSNEYKGKPFMDRVYINNSPDVELFKKFAKENQFVYKKYQDYSKEGFMFGNELTKIQSIDVKLENTSFHQYPYVDTLSYYTPWKSILSNMDDNYEYVLDNTDGSDGSSCERCDGEERVECYDCDGEGEVNCENCDGNGDNECHECEGDGKVDCSSCDGSGKDDEENDCSNCDGSGREDCFNCDGEGRRECAECNGRSTVECDTCDGDGRVDCPDCQ